MFARRLTFLAAGLGLSCLGYMTIGSRGGWDFLLPFRGTRLAALLLVAVAVSTSTILFQTIARNRILTPSIMGFDALYLLILSVSVFLLGGAGLSETSALARFLVSLGLLIVASVGLFGTLLLQRREDVMRMLLTGVVLATLFRSLSSLIARMIDPNEYSTIQVASYARFSRIETDLLGLSAVLILGVVGIAWRMRHRLDILALGRDAAINLGENPRRRTIEVLILVAVLVAVSTAFVGPIAFLGLLVVSLAHLVTPTGSHGTLLVSSSLIAGIALVGGQTVLERVLGLSTPLAVLIDLLGGLVFLILVLKGARR
ncbi:iron chelate uptake ABC transporter family permease subunit [Paracoccus sp. TK19116]|uniref:Iron chelate uptake ABC transporter family permease subunit n=1 Tax=Paracoccus albicereus TaxID=2922394 RepID=A0ABT1MMP4_9RHOB|nr:iron chelate uptake ABC transporter family permease subunit [Paracoccus albicereus]MCQ0969554.1 iron chelate uptake ABC transporter family permease subunit [Paracoccus albicereus]